MGCEKGGGMEICIFCMIYDGYMCVLRILGGLYGFCLIRFEICQFLMKWGGWMKILCFACVFLAIVLICLGIKSSNIQEHS